MFKNIFKNLLKIYRKIQFNLGIKKYIEKFIFKILNWYHFSFETKFLYRIYKLLDNHFTKKIIYHYGADYRWEENKSQNLNKLTNNLGYGQYHYSLLRNINPRRVLCIGSMYGFIPYMLAKSCEDNNYGHVDFVDADFNINDDADRSRHFFGAGFWGKTDVKKHFSYLLDSSYITMYKMTTKKFAKKYQRKYDYIYLDGDHSYEGAISDLSFFWPMLNLGGFVCFHDIEFKRVLEGVSIEFWKIWDDLKFMPYKFSLKNNYSGLGFIQKDGTLEMESFLKTKK